jgi:fatty acid desaturase
MSTEITSTAQVVPLIPVLTVDRDEIEPELAGEIKALMHPDPLNFTVQLLLAWCAIIVAIIAAECVQAWWFTMLAVVFVATRQNILALLMHEQTHRIGFKSAIGDVLCNFTCAYPLLISLEGYRRVHMAHHRHYFTQKDPDYLRKQGEEWTFPQRISRLVRSFLVDFSGASLWKMMKGKGTNPEGKIEKVGSIAWLRPVYYLGMAVVITVFHLWATVALYWVLPLATGFQGIIRLGAICEHRYDLLEPTLLNSTPLIELRWWEKLLLPNLNFSFHIYHHWYPSVPYNKLPCVHELFRRRGYVRGDSVFHGYGEYLRSLVTKREFEA